MESTGGACLRLHGPPHLRPQNWRSSIVRTGLPLIFSRPFRDPPYVAMAELQVSYSRFAAPTASWGLNAVFESPAALVLLVLIALSRSTLPFLRRFLRCFLRPTTAMARKKLIGDGLSARVLENSHQRRIHRDKNSHGTQNKHVDKT
jgi:hypothetical protein